MGQGLDSRVFITLTFAGAIPPARLASAIVTQCPAKAVQPATVQFEALPV